MTRAVAKPMKKGAPAEILDLGSPSSGRFVDRDHIVLRRGGKAVGVVISMDELRYFQGLEDRLDIRDAEKHLADPKRIPYEEVRRKLGAPRGDLLRVRVGDFRVIYAVDDRRRVVEIARIVDRKEAYRAI